MDRDFVLQLARRVREMILSARTDIAKEQLRVWAEEFEAAAAELEQAGPLSNKPAVSPENAAAESLSEPESFALDLEIHAKHGAVGFRAMLEQVGLVAMAVEPEPHFRHARHKASLAKAHLHRIQHSALLPVWGKLPNLRAVRYQHP